MKQTKVAVPHFFVLIWRQGLEATGLRAVSINAQTGTVTRTFNQQICWVDPVTGGASPPNDCDTDGDGMVDAVMAVGWQGGDCETPVSPLTLCKAVADCSDALNLCQSAQMGDCDAAAETCS